MKTMHFALVIMGSAYAVATTPSEDLTSLTYTRPSSYPWGTTCGDYEILTTTGPVGETNINICKPSTKILLGSSIDSQLSFEDVQYNGSMTLTTSLGNPTICTRTLTTHMDASFSIGDMVYGSDAKLNRNQWDDNPFFFQLDSGNSSLFDPQDGDAQWKVLMQSSTSSLVWGQAWTLSATKSGDGFDISGYIKTKKANAFNDWSYNHQCRHYRAFAGTVYERVNMTGRITATEASLKITMGNGTYGQDTVVFTGKWWDKGARLVINGTNPAAEGSAKATGNGGTTTHGRFQAWGLVVLIAGIIMLF